MKVLSTLALFTLLCTCVRAQIVIGEPLKYQAASIAFIKSPTIDLIDSITVHTSMDEEPYGFRFTEDTMLLEIHILLPVDELTIETFSGGHSFGQQRCWVDPPSADVHLSVVGGRGVIDSVGLSPVDKWYRGVASSLAPIKEWEARKYLLGKMIYDMNEDLVVTRFIEAYLRLPNITPTDAMLLRQVMNERFRPIRRHPDFQRLLHRVNLLATHRSGWFKKLAFRDAKGRLRNLPQPTTDFFVLEIYQREDPVCQENHEVLKTSPVLDSLLQKIPVISLTYQDSEALWRLYVKDGNFDWLHGLAEPSARGPRLEDWIISPHTTYLLVNDRFKLQGVYEDLERLARGLMWIKGK